MDEGRKRVILIAASILVARKASELDVASPALNDAMDDAITLAERMMRRIDYRLAMPVAPKPPDQRMTSNAEYPAEQTGIVSKQQAVKETSPANQRTEPG